MMLVKSTRLVMHSCLIMMVGNYQKTFVKFSVQNICRGEGKGIHKNNSGTTRGLLYSKAWWSIYVNLTNYRLIIISAKRQNLTTAFFLFLSILLMKLMYATFSVERFPLQTHVMGTNC